MKLLIVTQKVDKNDPILGFFHRWIEEFAKHAEKITVICLQKGEYHLPGNVSVYSLGKEQGKSRIKYVWNFYKYIFQFRHDYDAVFVHMNPEYVVLGGLMWRLMGKKIALWYTHKQVDLKLRVAEKLADKIFTASKESFLMPSPKVEVMGHGIDTNTFRPDRSAKEYKSSILYLGRISPIKNIDILIGAANVLNEKGINFKITIVGSPANPEDFEYEKSLREQSLALAEKRVVEFIPAVKNTDAPQIYNQHEVFVNLTPSGSLDKTVLEAMTSGMLVVAVNKSFQGVLGDALFLERNEAHALAKKLLEVMQLPSAQKEGITRTLRSYVIKSHNLTSLVAKIVKSL